MQNINKLFLFIGLLVLPLFGNAKTATIPKTLEGCISKIKPEQSQSPEGTGETCFFKDGKILVVGWGTMILGHYKIHPKQKVLSMTFPKTKQQDFSKYNAKYFISIKNGATLINEDSDRAMKIRPFNKDDKELFDIKKALEKELKAK